MNGETLKKNERFILDYRQAGTVHKREIVPKDLVLHQIAQTIEKMKRKGMSLISSK